MSGTLSSDSNDSVHNQAEVASQHASTVGTAGSKSSRSMAVLNTAVRHATDGFIGILDMFGFEDPKVHTLDSRGNSITLTCTRLFIWKEMFAIQTKLIIFFFSWWPPPLFPCNQNRSSQVSWNTCASTCVQKRCSISSTRTSSSRASNHVVRKAFNANLSQTTLITCPASTSSLLWYYLTYFDSIFWYAHSAPLFFNFHLILLLFSWSKNSEPACWVCWMWSAALEELLNLMFKKSDSSTSTTAGYSSRNQWHLIWESLAFNISLDESFMMPATAWVWIFQYFIYLYFFSFFTWRDRFLTSCIKFTWTL
jgi:hypothetical protein